MATSYTVKELPYYIRLGGIFHIAFNTSTPEGVVTAGPGSICQTRVNSTTGGAVYVKLTGSGNTGWASILTTNTAGTAMTVNGVTMTFSTGSPNGVVTGNVGDEYTDKNGAAGGIKWIKQTGTATNTGWVPIA